MRVAVSIAAIVVLAGVADAPRSAAADAPDGGSIVGLGFGPAARVSGDLAGSFGGGAGGGRIRMGGRFGHVGVDLAIVIAGLDGDLPGEQSAVMWEPTLAYYPLATPWIQLGPRVGLGFGAIEGIEQEGTTTSYPGFALDLGATLQLHLGRRRGGRAVLWADASSQLWRVQFPDRVVTGRITQLTVGVAHGMAF